MSRVPSLDVTYPEIIRLGTHGRLEYHKSMKGDEKEEKPHRVIVPYYSRGIEGAHPKDLLHELSSYFGIDPPKIQIAWSTMPSLQDLFMKTGELFRDRTYSVAQLEARCLTKSCACGQLPSSLLDPGIGHLHTTQTDFMHYLGLGHLAELFEKELNFIWPKDLLILAQGLFRVQGLGFRVVLSRD